ncbi:hypothetical protein BCR22_07810 [Enterococcus plantarum]|uniref:hypothetical protein n=1 Tax=Enterococcus plantarum TaxID=1077675 RepID=UPI00084D3F41|nr:hypothetical protein [Enterococcus plantarum]OEG08893.1 hypothetical protein BCR22_07810 [Enterococcus plantarum]
MATFFEIIRIMFFFGIIYMFSVMKKELPNLKSNQKLAVYFVIATGLVLLIPDFINAGNGFIKGLTESITSN